MKQVMKTFEWSVTIYTIVGPEHRKIETVGRTQAAAEKRLRQMMGNRDFQINWGADISWAKRSAQ